VLDPAEARAAFAEAVVNSEVAPIPAFCTMAKAPDRVPAGLVGEARMGYSFQLCIGRIARVNNSTKPAHSVGETRLAARRQGALWNQWGRPY
jgi:hypothetical protein